MSSVTVENVRNCVDLSSAVTDPMVQQSIQTAESIADGPLAGQDLDPPIIEQIILYLSAHFCSLREPQIFEEEWGGRDSIAKEKRAKPLVGVGLNATWYGQQAIMLDTSGTLADMSEANKKKAGISVYGPYDEADPYGS